MADIDPTANTSEDQPRSRPAIRLVSRLANWTTTTLAAAGAIGLVVIGTMTIHERATASINAEAGPTVFVETMTVTRVTSVERMARYVGQIEPARSNRLAFERPGTLISVLVDEGDRVAEGKVVARIDTRALNARKAELEARRDGLEARVELAELTLERQSELRDRGHASTQTFDEARLQLARLAAGLVEIDAGLWAIDVDLAKSDLIAPFAGQVTARLLDEGGVVAPGAAVLEMIEAARPQLRVGVPMDQARSLSVGDAVAVDHPTGKLDGIVAAIRPDIDPATRARIVLVDLPASGGLAFGSTAELVLAEPMPMSGFWIPITALREGARGLWTVTTMVETNTGLEAGSETVEILLLKEDRAFVRGTLRDGGAIVANGAHRLVPGTRIAVRDPS